MIYDIVYICLYKHLDEVDDISWYDAGWTMVLYDVIAEIYVMMR